MVFKKGHKHSEEIKQKISLSHRGIKPSLETRQKLSQKKKELWQNAEYRRHMSEVHKGKNYNRQGLIDYWKTHKRTEEHKQKLKQNHPKGITHPNYKGGKEDYGTTKSEWALKKKNTLVS